MGLTGLTSEYEQRCVSAGDGEFVVFSDLYGPCTVLAHGLVLSSKPELHHSDLHFYCYISFSVNSLFLSSFTQSLLQYTSIIQDNVLHLKLIRKLNSICNLNFPWHVNISLGFKDQDVGVAGNCYSAHHRRIRERLDRTEARESRHSQILPSSNLCLWISKFSKDAVYIPLNKVINGKKKNHFDRWTWAPTTSVGVKWAEQQENVPFSLMWGRKRKFLVPFSILLACLVN